MDLTTLGWDDARAQEFGATWAGKDDVRPGRVAIEFNYLYRVFTEEGEVEAMLAGRVKHHAVSRSEMPAVGDWVALRRRGDEARGAIVSVLPRRSRFSRKMAGNVTDEQVVAANIDVIFIVMALDGDYSIRRLERYLLLAHESGSRPVVLLTKPDVAADPAAHVAEVAALAGDVPVHLLSPKLNQGLDQVAAYLTRGRTAALLGSSGVGKTTIINRLAGDEARRTREVRHEDSKGRHTTTHRELVILPGGGLIVDTPGMRELQLWDAANAVRETFDDVEALASGCRFTDCRHLNEPQCAVKAAVEQGTIDAARLASYLKLQEELAFLARQQDERALIDEKRRGKVGAKSLRQVLKLKRG